MQKSKTLLMACVLALSASPVLAADKAADSVQACWQPAFEAMDANAVAQCYAPDAVLWLPGNPVMKGRDAIRDGYVGFFSAFTIKSMTLVEMGNSDRGGDRSSWGNFTLVTASKSDGKEVTQVGRYTDVSRKIGGKWMYLVDHASDDPPPAPGPSPSIAPAIAPAK